MIGVMNLNIMTKIFNNIGSHLYVNPKQMH